MTAYIFAGPTLPHEEISRHCDALCLPPAAQGDIYRAALDRPRAIGLIDGYFEGVPSVWHKEILWAMSQGIAVFGSASMGALRAAELYDFGMQGVGRIFEAYRDGAIEDDDEVAVLHGPAEAGYPCVSEPMVNIRFTLERAESQGLIAPATGQALTGMAKAMFYQERNWQDVLDGAADSGLPEDELGRLATWLPEHRVDQKRSDALAMLDAVQARLAAGSEPERPRYSFEWTELWDKSMGFSAALPRRPDGGATMVTEESVLDELRLDPEAFHDAGQRALLRLLALREFDRQRLGVDPQDLKATATRFRAERRLFNRREIDRWLTDNDSDLASLERLLDEEARLAALGAETEPLLRPQLFGQLRLSGDYPRLAERARRKARAIDRMGLQDGEPGVDGPTPAALLAWYFQTLLGQAIPEQLDAVPGRLGLKDMRSLHRILLREYLYVTYNDDEAASDTPPTGG